jgi:hypothetical protein
MSCPLANKVIPEAKPKVTTAPLLNFISLFGPASYLEGGQWHAIWLSIQANGGQFFRLVTAAFRVLSLSIINELFLEP